MAEIFTSYDAIAKEYAQVTETKPIHVHYERPNTWSLLPSDLTNKNVLDAGCGSGWYTEELIKHGATVTALDACKEFVELTQKRVEGKAKVMQLKLEDCEQELANQQFDIILAPLVIHYVKDWRKLFSTFANLLKPNGSIVLSTHNPLTCSMLFELETYFSTVLLEDEWDSPKAKVFFYHHTLHDLFDALYYAGFITERLIEPKPPEEMKDNPTFYEKMQKQPWFIFLRARKIS